MSTFFTQDKTCCVLPWPGQEIKFDCGTFNGKQACGPAAAIFYPSIEIILSEKVQFRVGQIEGLANLLNA
jgi:hypothetical protein